MFYNVGVGVFEASDLRNNLTKSEIEIELINIMQCLCSLNRI